MKKLFISLCLIFIISLSGFAQRTETTTLFKGAIEMGRLKWEITNKKSLETERTYCYIWWQNAKYSHITDIGSLIFSSPEKL